MECYIREKPGPLKRNRVITICFYPKRAAATALFKTLQKYEKIYVSGSYCRSVNSFNACTKDELKAPSDAEIAKVSKADVYLENGYLVVKNLEVVDSLKKLLHNSTIADQYSWEQKLGFKSAKSFRIQSSEKLASIQNQKIAENYITELIKDGYFSMQDSSLCYPFYNYSWDCVLNKNGLIKIGDVLYCFQKDAQVAILDGSSNTLNQFLVNGENYNKSLVKVFPFQKLKSTTPVNYGEVQNVVMYNSNNKKRFTLALLWEPVKIQVLNIDLQWVTVQSGNMYQLYFHNQTKSLWWWNDNRTYFYNRHISFDFGGNYDPFIGLNFNRYTNNTPGSWYQVNSTEVANEYHEVVRWEFGTWYDEGTFLSYPGATIYNFSCQGACDTFGGYTNPLNLTIY